MVLGLCEGKESTISDVVALFHSKPVKERF